MATLVLGVAAGALATSAATAAGYGILATSLFAAGATAVGGLIGQQFDNAILGVGSRGTNLTRGVTALDQVLNSTWGKAIPIAYGYARIAGNVIWQSDARQEIIQQTERVQTGKFSSRRVVTGETRETRIDLLIALSAVPSLLSETLSSVESTEEDTISIIVRRGAVGLQRVWFSSELVYDARTFNEKPEKIEGFTIGNFFDGQESQTPEEYIEDIEGVGNVPAFRGLAMLFLQDVDLIPFGERIPNINVEIVASLPKLQTEFSPADIILGNDGKIYTLNRLQRTLSAVEVDTLRNTSTLARSDPDEYLGDLNAQPYRMTLDPATGYIWLTNSGDATVQVVDPVNDTIIQTIDVGYYPFGIAQGGDNNFWITLPLQNKVARIDRSSYAYTEFNIAGSPREIIKATNGDLFTGCNNDIVRFNTSGTELARGNIGYFITGMTVNTSTNTIWICNTGLNIITILSQASNAVTGIRSTGTWPVGISSPIDDEYGSVAVATLYGNQVKTLSKELVELADYGTASFPERVLHLSNGKIFVTQSKYNFCYMIETR